MRRTLLALVVVALALAARPAPVAAQGFGQVGFATFTTDVTVTTTTEKDVIYSGPVPVNHDNAHICVFGYAQLTTGTSTTGVIPLIRRGAGIAGTAVNESNNEPVKAAAGSTESMFAFGCEDRSNVATVDYSFTVKQAGAAANGAALSGGILVLVQ